MRCIKRPFAGREPDAKTFCRGTSRVNSEDCSLRPGGRCAPRAPPLLSGPAADVDRLAAHVGGVLARQEGDGAGDVLRQADTAEGVCSAASSWSSSKLRPRRAAVRSVMRVATEPGARQLTVIPKGPSSIASVRVIPWKPALAAA